ncbi:MAG: hypothetical protein J1E39_05420 [Eubacterium sp.]|nr:hypothetical protein [Eubacterium sp.]
MKHEKHPNHEQPDFNEPKRKEKKKRKKRGKGIFIFLLLLIIAALVFMFFNPFGWGGGGAFGLGSQNDSSSSSDSSAAADSSEPETDKVIIKIEDEDIYFDGELCTEAELKEKIIALGTEKSYELEHPRAIKSVYDSVKSVLAELEDSLGITVNYNE